MECPNFESYSLSQLNDALSGLDRNAYPDREILIKSEIEKRKSAGFVAEDEYLKFLDSDISFFDVAMPVWWCSFWRQAAAGLVLNFFLAIFLVLVGLVLGLEESTLKVLFVCFCIVAIPFMGTFFIRQALEKKYKNFSIKIVQNDG